MNKVKCLSISIVAAVLLSVSLMSCGDDPAQKGKEAGEALCKCAEKEDSAKCEEEVAAKYVSFAENAEYIKARDEETAKCPKVEVPAAPAEDAAEETPDGAEPAEVSED